MGFLLKKSTHGKYLDAYRLKPIKTQYFKRKLRAELECIKEKYESNQIKIRNFYREDTDENTLSILDVSKHASIKNTIEQILQSADANPIDSMKSMRLARFSAMLYDIPDEKSMIALDFVSIFSKSAFEKGGLVATYDEVGLEELKKDSALVFRFGLPCIYFEEEEKLLVLNKPKTEEIFNLLEHYQEKASAKFKELEDEEIIDIDNALLQGELKNITTARRINNMIEGDMFTTDIGFYKKYEKFFSEHSDLDDELTKLTIKQGKVLLHDKNHFQSYLHMTSYNIQQSVIEDEEIYIAFQKRKVKRKRP